jgi:Arc/MetJ-type ribon-helix-helix transcriptional regulator
MRANKTISISLPPDMTEEVQEMAKKERRSVGELLREAFRQYAADKFLEDVRKAAGRVAKKNGIKPGDVEQIVRTGRGKR